MRFQEPTPISLHAEQIFFAQIIFQYTHFIQSLQEAKAQRTQMYM